MSSFIQPEFSMENALSEYISYPFDSDEAYQQGLASILANGAIDPDMPPEVMEEMILKTKVFYFNSMAVAGNPITVEQVKERVRQTSTVLEQSSSTFEREDESQSHILSFAELQDLIYSGKVDQIPNNKIIPDKLNESSQSQSKAVLRKKPWEVALIELP